MRLLIAIFLSLSLWGYSPRLEAENHADKQIPVTFDICLSYAICSFNFTEDRAAAKSMRFSHDKVVARLSDLGNISFIDECNSGVSDFRAYIWQLVMQRIAQADRLFLVGEKFRSSLQGSLYIDGSTTKSVTLSILENYNKCMF
jgi:hypothetical protein